MGEAIGIDLGERWAIIAYFDGGAPEVLDNKEAREKRPGSTKRSILLRKPFRT